MSEQGARPRERIRYAFLLGAGFSKSVDPRMPTTTELLERLKEAAVDEGWPFAVESGIERFDDLESWLDSVAISQPYRSDSEDSSALGLFQRATQWIATYISGVEHQIVHEPQPVDWLAEFLKFVDRERCHLTTLNYDTIIERAWSDGYDDWALDLRLAAPMQSAPNYLGRPSTMDRSIIVPDRCLSKLHGSVDWGYAGGSGRGVPLYRDWRIDGSGWYSLMPQLVPYIIPPSFSKNVLYDHEIIRAHWRASAHALGNADMLVIMGYSLPPADTSIRQLLRLHAPRRITVVDTDPSVAKRFRECLGIADEDCNVSTSIPKWVQAQAVGAG